MEVVHALVQGIHFTVDVVDYLPSTVGLRDQGWLVTVHA